MIRVLFACTRDDYDEPGRGESFEYANFFGTLSRMAGVRADYFDTGNRGRRDRMLQRSQELFERTADGDYDLLFLFPTTEEISFEVLKKITGGTRTVTLCWFADDHWRFDDYSSRLCRAFDHVVTTDPVSYRRYAEIGYEGAFLSQWGFNHFAWVAPSPVARGVSFVGQRYGKRNDKILALSKSGLDFRCYGFGWNVAPWTRWRNIAARALRRKEWVANEGRVSLPEMLSIFATSRINVNFSDSYAPGRKQIKARNFEVTGAGGFLLTEESEGLVRYFRIGEEVVTFRDPEDLIEKTRHYLVREEERKRIAEAGRNRTRADHTYERRFREIFGKIRKKSRVV
ncbi:MAG: glycosyltransferase [Candidatus Deferrimicrobiaceae bacterium]